MNNKTIKEIIEGQNLANKFVIDSQKGFSKKLDEYIAQSSDSIFYDSATLTKIKKKVDAMITTGYNFTKAGVLIPVGLWGLKQGFPFPDSDISLLGIGNHRFFLFHSALELVALRYLYKKWIEKLDEDKFKDRVTTKVTGALLGSFSMGVGIHLTIDLFQPKSIVFPFFGSLINETLVDDNIWLLGNSLWAFKIGKDIFSLTLASEIETAKEYVKSKFGSSFDYNNLEVIK
ncbi:MAG: hypothetical protein F9K42_05380 [Ignavibacterium sp.]|nr:MAG: hypothetical protein F9K42_05380 [Ignavibacterium sp.]